MSIRDIILLSEFLTDFKVEEGVLPEEGTPAKPKKEDGCFLERRGIELLGDSAESWGEQGYLVANLEEASK